MKKIKKIHSLLYAMEQVPDIGKTKLVKFTFFADLISINQRGRPVFDSTYIRMPNGPVDEFAFSLAGQPNAFFDVVAPEAIVSFNSRFPRPARTSRAHTAPQSTKFTPRVKADISLFSTYEKVLFDSVLRVLRRRNASSISEITHQLRLWREFSDGDTIPLAALRLEPEEKDYLQAQGFFFDGFSKFFCEEIARDTQDLKDIVLPLTPVRMASIVSTVDRLIKAYPIEEYESFYDTYLAWDDTYRLALKSAPTLLPELAEEGSEALCTYVLGKETRCMREPEIEAYAESYIRHIEDIRSSILMGCSEISAQGKPVDDYVDQLMRISCDLAMQR